MSGEQPIVVVLGGINGAGKTTASRKLLADHLAMKTFVNADLIAKGLNALSPESVAFEAGRVMIARLRQLASTSESFAFESTLAGRTYVKFLKELRSLGYRIELYYFWLSSAELAIQRVSQRVVSGGHHVPDDTIRQRYLRSVKNCWQYYRPASDLWMLYNNDGFEPDMVAEGSGDGEFVVRQPRLWTVFQELAHGD